MANCFLKDGYLDTYFADLQTLGSARVKNRAGKGNGPAAHGTLVRGGLEGDAAFSTDADMHARFQDGVADALGARAALQSGGLLLGGRRRRSRSHDW